MFADSGPRLVNLAYFGPCGSCTPVDMVPDWPRLAPQGEAVSATLGASDIDAFLAVGVAGLAGARRRRAADRVGRAATAAGASA